VGTTTYIHTWYEGLYTYAYVHEKSILFTIFIYIELINRAFFVLIERNTAHNTRGPPPPIHSLLPFTVVLVVFQYQSNDNNGSCFRFLLLLLIISLLLYAGLGPCRCICFLVDFVLLIIIHHTTTSHSTSSHAIVISVISIKAAAVSSLFTSISTVGETFRDSKYNHIDNNNNISNHYIRYCLHEGIYDHDAIVL